MKGLEEKSITRQIYAHVRARFTLDRSTGSSSSTKEEVGIISEVAALVVCIIGCNRALKMATTYRFNFRQEIIEAHVKRLRFVCISISNCHAE
jgi:hypothetical protein